jgi:hypothetical protein
MRNDDEKLAFCKAADRAAMQWGRTGSFPDGFTATVDQLGVYFTPIERLYEDVCGEDQAMFLIVVQRAVFLCHGLAKAGVRIPRRVWSHLMNLEDRADKLGLCEDAVRAVHQWMHHTGKHLNQDYIIAALEFPMTQDEIDLIPVAEAWRKSHHAGS